MLRSGKFQILFWRLSVRQWTGHHLFTYLSSPIWHQAIIWTNADLLSIGLPTLTSVANDLLNDVLRLDNGASATYGSARMSRQNNCTPNNTFYFREILINIQNISVKKNALETAVCKIWAILSKLKCVRLQGTHCKHPSSYVHTSCMWQIRDHSGYAPSQWETMLYFYIVSQWLTHTYNNDAPTEMAPAPVLLHKLAISPSVNSSVIFDSPTHRFSQKWQFRVCKWNFRVCIISLFMKIPMKMKESGWF